MMNRSTLAVAAAALFAVTVGACGGGDGASTYEATRDGENRPPQTRPRDTEPPRTTPGSIVLPTFPRSTTSEPTDSTSTPSSIPATDDITVTGTWFADDGYGGIDWGITFESTATTAYEDVPVVVDFLDANGVSVGTSETYINLVVAGTGAAADYESGLEGTAATMEVTIGEGYETSFTPAGELTVSDTAVDAEAGTVTGLITSTYPTDLDDVEAVAVWRDAAGALAGVSSDYVRTVQAGGATWFSVLTPGELSTPPNEVYVTPRATPYETTPPDATLTLAESWYVPDGTGGLTWGAIVDNAGTDSWLSPSVTARFYDDAGRLVETDDAYFGEARPGKAATVSYVWSAPAPIARMEVTITDGGYSDTPTVGTLTVADIAVADDGYVTTLTANVTSGLAETEVYVEIIFVWRDAAGTVTFATSAYTDEIAPGATIPLEATMYEENAPTTPPTETYWSA